MKSALIFYSLFHLNTQIIEGNKMTIYLNSNSVGLYSAFGVENGICSVEKNHVILSKVNKTQKLQHNDIYKKNKIS